MFDWLNASSITWFNLLTIEVLTLVQKYGPKGFIDMISGVLGRKWRIYWLSKGSSDRLGRLAFYFASLFAPPHKAAVALAMMTARGYIDPGATIFHPQLHLGENVYIGNRVHIFCDKDGGAVELCDQVRVFRDSIIDTGRGGSLYVGKKTSIHPRCQLNAYKTKIEIGQGVLLAANCCIYPHDHGFKLGIPIIQQALRSKGPVVIGDYAWLGTGVIVLGGVSIGSGAVVGAGAVVTRDIPENAIAVGVPAKVVGMRQ